MSSSETQKSPPQAIGTLQILASQLDVFNPSASPWLVGMRKLMPKAVS